MANQVNVVNVVKVVNMVNVVNVVEHWLPRVDEGKRGTTWLTKGRLG